MNLSNFMWFGLSTKTMAKSAAQTDALLGEILADIDPEQHRAEIRPRRLGFRLLLLVPKLLWALPRPLWAVVRNLTRPEHGRQVYARDTEAFVAEFSNELDYTLPLTEFSRRYTLRTWLEMARVTMPALLVGLISAAAFAPKKPRAQTLARRLRRGFTDNIVVEQGIALFRLARLLDRADFEDLDGLARRLREREMQTRFLRAWDTFIERFGCRGPHEMDVASKNCLDR